MSLPTLGILVCLFTMAGCGGNGDEALVSSSTAAATSTSTTGAADGESSSTHVADGGESASTDAGMDGESTSDGSAPSTSQQATLTVETLGARVADMLSTSQLVVGGESHPGWSCAAGAVSIGQQESEAVTTGPLAAGSVATCRPSPVPPEGEHPVVTVLVLDDGGKVSVAESGLAFPLLFPTRPMGVGEEVPSGSNCTDLLAAGSVFSREAENLPLVKRYFAVVLYWFLEGRPSPLMDIDENGVPCETLFSADVVDAVWSGGWLAE